MGSERALYWIAVGVLGLFVSNHFAARHEDEVRCFATRSLAAIQQVSGQATHFMAMAEMMISRGETSLVGPEAMLARAQTRLASVQCVIASHEAGFAKVQAEQARMAAMEELDRAVICPRQNLRIVVAQMPRNGTI